MPIFLDSNHVIGHYKYCLLNPKYSNIDGLGLDEIWCYISGYTHLIGAHGSLVNAHTHVTIICGGRFK